MQKGNRKQKEIRGSYKLRVLRDFMKEKDGSWFTSMEVCIHFMKANKGFKAGTNNIAHYITYHRKELNLEQKERQSKRKDIPTLWREKRGKHE